MEYGQTAKEEKRKKRALKTRNEILMSAGPETVCGDNSCNELRRAEGSGSLKPGALPSSRFGFRASFGVGV